MPPLPGTTSPSPSIPGEKSESERFPGAVRTLTIEAMVQDRKAIQAGTSHFLGQNFAKASNIQFVSRQNTQEFAWTTSWGVSTRLIGTAIMAHADDDGMIVPPRLAPAHVVILPITPKPDTRDAVLAAAGSLAEALRAQSYAGDPVSVEVDMRDLPGGAKNWDWIKKGIPIRIEIGPRDLEKGTVALCRRDQAIKEKQFLTVTEAAAQVPGILQAIQDTLYGRALAYRDANTREIDTREAFQAFFTPQNAARPEIHGGFARAHWCGSTQCEATVKDELKVTIRCIPFDAQPEPGACVICGAPSGKRVLWAKSY